MLADFLGTDPRPRQAHTSQIAVYGQWRKSTRHRTSVNAARQGRIYFPKGSWRTDVRRGNRIPSFDDAPRRAALVHAGAPGETAR